MFEFVRYFFAFDPIAIILLMLITFIGLSVGSFASRYLKGDTRYRSFFSYLFFLLLSTAVMVSTDHLLFFFGGWCVSNFLVVKLMIHKAQWKAAKNSGLLAGKNYLLGAFCIGIAFFILYMATGETSIKLLMQKKLDPFLCIPISLLLLIGAMTQSAIWPFHRWLISSLNSPTPVSAIMHAGLINGGGFLLVRFAPLYITHPYFLTTIFVIGMTTAFIGTFWKLLQNDVKRMLACSTMGQMGFMLAQCGLGLFAAAIAHLVTHGMFKAYLFLASAGASHEKRHPLNYPPKIGTLSSALLCGLLGSYCFSLASGKPWIAKDTTLVLMVVALLASTQAALTVLSLRVRFKTVIALLVTSVTGLAYGAGMSLITMAIQPMQLIKPQTLNGFHIAAIFLLIASWLSMLFFKQIAKIRKLHAFTMRGYVTALNASQPHPKTVTPHRNQYKYL